jgi:transposase
VNSSTNSLHASHPPTEVTPKAKRRRFTAEYKRQILKEADACERGEVGALLRREGLYSSHLIEWRRARDAGELAGLTPRKRGPKARAPDPSAAKLAAAEREVARLKAENAKLQLICEVQKKISLLLGLEVPTMSGDEKDGSSS